MIKNIQNLLELKYKKLIDNNNISLQKLHANIKNDIEICTEFLKHTAQPYKQLFESKDED